MAVISVLQISEIAETPLNSTVAKRKTKKQWPDSVITVGDKSA